jgi:hypothetical protein
MRLPILSKPTNVYVKLRLGYFDVLVAGASGERASFRLPLRKATSSNSDVKPNPSRTSVKILAYIDLIKEHLYKPNLKHMCVSNPTATIWTPSPQGTVLINSDAAIFEAAECMGVGVAVRDHRDTLRGSNNLSMRRLWLFGGRTRLS